MSPLDDHALAGAGVLPGERENLDLHVELCARRYQATDRRLKRIEYGVYVVASIILGIAGIGAREVLPLIQNAATIASAMSGAPPVPGLASR